MNDNFLNFYSNSIMVDEFIQDTTPPLLQSFDFDLSNNTLTLLFSELINVSSIDLSTFTITSNFDNPTQYQNFTFTGGSLSGPAISSGNPPLVYVSLLLNDTNRIKNLPFLANDNQSTFLSISNNAAFDYSNNSLLSINLNSAISVSNYIPDEVRPILIDFYLDLDSDILTLFFNEIIKVTSLNISQITLQSIRNSTQDLHSLVDSSTKQIVNDDTISIELGFLDSNNIKYNRNLCTHFSNCFLSFPFTLLQDINANQIYSVLNSDAKNIKAFYPDMTSPSLVFARLDMDSSEIVLTFDEPVDEASLNISLITIQSAPENLSNGSNFIYLSSNNSIYNYIINNMDGILISIDIGLNDLYTLQRNLNLATNSNNSFISFDSFVRDMNFNLVNPIFPQNASQILLIPDSIGPVLMVFSLDLDTSYLSLTFDEVINGFSLVATRIIISSQINIQNVSFSPIRLSSSTTVLTAIDRIISLILTEDDLNQLKLSLGPTTSVNITFLIMEAFCLTDTANPGI